MVAWHVVVLFLAAVASWPASTHARIELCPCSFPVKMSLGFARMEKPHDTTADFEWSPDTSPWMRGVNYGGRPVASLGLLWNTMSFCLNERPLGMCASRVYSNACQQCAALHASNPDTTTPPPSVLEDFNPKLVFSAMFPSYNDADRLDLLHLAVQNTVRERVAAGARANVLDLDLGSGFLAHRALAAGAHRVAVHVPYGRAIMFTAVDGVRRHTTADQFAHQVEFWPWLQDLVAAVQAANASRPVDVIVWDMQDSPAVLARQLSALAVASSRLLAPGGSVVPAGASVWVMLIDEPAAWQRTSVHAACGFNVSRLNRLSGFEEFRFGFGSRDYLALSEPIRLVWMDFAQMHRLSHTVTATGQVTERGRASTVVSWMEWHMDAPHFDDADWTLRTGPLEGNTHHPHYQPKAQTLPNPTYVNVGDAVTVTATISVDADPLSVGTEYPFTFTVAFDKGDGASAAPVVPVGYQQHPQAALVDFSVAEGLELGSRRRHLAPPSSDDGDAWLHGYAIPDWHFTMVNDLPRNEAYERGIVAAVTPQSVVLDIGAGTGLLAMLAARAGAARVYTVEMDRGLATTARGVIRDNGLQDRITLYNMVSTDMAVGAPLPERANVLVFEVFSSDIFEEGLFYTLNHALDNLLTPDVKVVPPAVSMYAMPIQSVAFRKRATVQPHRPQFGGAVHDFQDVQVANNGLAMVSEWLHDNEYQAMGPVHRVRTWALHKHISGWEFDEWAVRASRSGVVDAVAYWFDCDFHDGSVFSMDPRVKRDSLTSHWTQNVYMMEAPRPARIGDDLHMAMSFHAGKTAFNVTTHVQ